MGFRTVDFFSPVIYGVFTLFNTLMVIFGLGVRIKDGDIALGGGWSPFLFTSPRAGE